MSIPLDKLYHYIESIAQDIRGDNVLIYRFFPHGSKKLEDLTPLSPAIKKDENFLLYPRIYCNDQEPLNYNFYVGKRPAENEFTKLLVKHGMTQYLYRNIDISHSIHDQPLLIHSEKRSKNLELYQSNNFISVYYWCHALIALDWFRFAQHETQIKNVKNTFLIYNRAWSGTREYRLKLVDLLIEHNLVNECQVSVNPIEPELGLHYTQHQYINTAWRPNHHLEHYVKDKPIADSHYSADYDIVDYNSTEIEVVLETLFDDDRLHLTEKILRPIALGQPFILAGTHGSLEYLRSYGFKTFNEVFDETYDTITDPELRLQAIVQLMKKISEWSDQEKEEKLNLANQIAEYNRKHFFSDDFFNYVTTELRTNIEVALCHLEETNTCVDFLTRRKALFNIQEIRDALFVRDSRESMKTLISTARRYYMRTLTK